MNNNTVIYNLTRHAVERLMERFPHIAKKRNLDYLLNTKNVKIDQYFDIFNDLCKESTENKSILNNSIFMVTYYEKYGWNVQFKFLEHPEHNLLMIFAKESWSQCYSLITVIPSSYWKSKANALNRSKTKATVWKAINLAEQIKITEEHDHLDSIIRTSQPRKVSATRI